ncbi:SWIM zinc finger family protein [Halorarum halophilum]|uniref:SWIM zinc finger family protein n=1 Tax=Halorarum halophilum TaxID=2743090 RepID=A0A7D5GFF5_9EURY|nr:SWIM zinc finger family protein [Halobaculum halophilum]QLG27710.1 SWIM zinc finger family protein [Halobaculum halophilum]
MSADTPTPPSTDETAPGEALDFDALAGTDTTSWRRADPQRALIESVGRYGYRVALQDGADVHIVAVALDDDEHVGTCDCRGFEYHDGPCAHLCTVRKAAFIDAKDTHGDSVRIRRIDLDNVHDPERAATDGGHIDRAMHTNALEGRR